MNVNVLGPRLQATVPQLQTEVTCALCPRSNGLLKDAHTISTCQHNFCRECITNDLGHTGQCPICKTPAWVKDARRNLILQNVANLFENLCQLTGWHPALNGSNQQPQSLPPQVSPTALEPQSCGRPRKRPTAPTTSLRQKNKPRIIPSSVPSSSPSVDGEPTAVTTSITDSATNVQLSNSPADSPGSGAVRSKGTTWACSTCTFLNQPLKRICELCRTKRPVPSPTPPRRTTVASPVRQPAATIEEPAAIAPAPTENPPRRHTMRRSLSLLQTPPVQQLDATRQRPTRRRRASVDNAQTRECAPTHEIKEPDPSAPAKSATQSAGKRKGKEPQTATATVKRQRVLVEPPQLFSTSTSAEPIALSDAHSPPLPRTPIPIVTPDSDVCIVASGLTDEQKMVLQKHFPRLAKFRNARILSEYDPPAVTHVVTSVDVHGHCRRTRKYMLGILNGAWIVRFDWFEKSAEQGAWVAEEPYEVHGDTVFGMGCGPRRARQAALAKEPRLFTGCKVFLYGDFITPPRDELEILLQAGGARLLTHRPPPKSLVAGSRSEPIDTSKAIVVYDPTLDLSRPQHSHLRSKQQAIDSIWVLNCISCYAVGEHVTFADPTACAITFHPTGSPKSSPSIGGRTANNANALTSPSTATSPKISRRSKRNST